MASARWSPRLELWRAADHPTLRVLGGPLPVLLVGFIFGLTEAIGRAWQPLDAILYWQASARLDHLYANGWTGAYNYASPPLIAQIWAPFHLLPFEVVLVAWVTFLFGCLWYATQRWALPIIVVGLIGIGLDIPALSAPIAISLLGNVGMLMTAGVVATVRRAEAVAIPALTKVGPSIALGWHLFRGDLRAVALGVSTTLVILGISFVLLPGAWIDWVGWIARNYASSPLKELAIPFVVRVPIGIAIVALAARSGRPWLVPIGAGLCIPADYGLSFVTVWVGAFGLLGRHDRGRTT